VVLGVIAEGAGLIRGNERDIRVTILYGDRKGAVGLLPIVDGKRFSQFGQGLETLIPQIIRSVPTTFDEANFMVVGGDLREQIVHGADFTLDFGFETVRGIGKAIRSVPDGRGQVHGGLGNGGSFR